MRIAIVLILLFSLTSINTANAQRASINWGPVEKTDKNKGNIEAIGWLDDSFYSLRQQTTMMLKSNFYLERVDKNMNIRYSKKLDLKDYFAPAVLFKDKKIYMYRLSAKETGFSSIGLHEAIFDLNGRKIQDRLVTELDNIGRYNFNKTTTIIEVSPNGKQLGVVIAKEELKDDQVEVTTIHIPVDEPENYQSEIKLFEAVENANDADLAQVFVNNQGHILFSLGTADRNFNNQAKSEPYEYSLIPWGPETGYGKAQKLVFDGVFFDQILIEKIDEDFFMTGMLLVKEEKKSQYIGFFLCKLNSENAELSNLSTFPYETSFFEALGYKIKKGGRIAFNGYFHLGLQNLETDGGYLIADHRVSNYASKELIAIPFDSEGNLGTLSVLPKYQYDYNAANKPSMYVINSIGYFAFSKGDQLHIVYADHKDNIEVIELDDLKNAKKPDDKEMVAVMAKINQGEKVEREILYSVKEKKGAFLIPEKCFAKDGRFIIHIADGKHAQYGQLKFD